MDENDPIQDMSSFHKARLLWDEKLREKGFEPVSNDLGDDFVDDIT